MITLDLLYNLLYNSCNFNRDISVTKGHCDSQTS